MIKEFDMALQKGKSAVRDFMSKAIQFSPEIDSAFAPGTSGISGEFDGETSDPAATFQMYQDSRAAVIEGKKSSTADYWDQQKIRKGIVPKSLE